MIDRMNPHLRRHKLNGEETGISYISSNHTIRLTLLVMDHAVTDRQNAIDNMLVPNFVMASSEAPSVASRRQHRAGVSVSELFVKTSLHQIALGTRWSLRLTPHDSLGCTFYSTSCESKVHCVNRVASSLTIIAFRRRSCEDMSSRNLTLPIVLSARAWAISLRRPFPLEHRSLSCSSASETTPT